MEIEIIDKPTWVFRYKNMLKAQEGNDMVSEEKLIKAWANGNLKKETLKYLDIFKDYPYIFNLGHGVVPETDPMKVDYLVKLVKDY